MHHNNQFTTEHLLLRALNRADLEQLQTAISQSSDTVGKWLDWCKSDFSETDARIWINESRQAWFAGRFYELAVIERQSNTLIGCLCVHSIERNANLGNLGYWISSAYQGKGYGLEAAKKTVEIAFKYIKLTRLEIIIDPNNVGSRTIAEKLDAHFETIARNRFIFNAEPHDGLVYSLIPADIGLKNETPYKKNEENQLENKPNNHS